MPPENEEKVAQLLDELVAFAHERLPAATFGIVEPLLRHYYDLADGEDLLARNVADLYGAVMAHWQTAQKFVPGTARLRVYNPNLEEHGWHSDHSIVEIVNDDMPFLVDSVTTEINRHGLTLHSAIHPVFRVCRDARGGIESIGLGGGEMGATNCRLESFIHFEVDRTGEATQLEALRNAIARPRRCAGSRGRLAAHATDCARHNRRHGPGPDAATPESVEARAFLEWMLDDHFTFLGHRDYELISRDGQFWLRGVAGSGAGILREALRDPAADDLTSLPAAARSIIEGATPIFLTKANSRATVHRPGYLDYVGVKLLDANGKLFGERRFVGLYTSTAYMVSTSEIPLVRRKCANILSRAGFLTKGHLYKSLVTILEQYPRDDCSRPTKTSCSTSRSASCGCRNTSARACSCGATASTALSPAWCSCRATSTTPTCASASRSCWCRRSTAPVASSRRCCPNRRWHASRSRCAGSPARCPRRYARARRADRAGHAPLAGRPPPRCTRAAARSTATGCCAATATRSGRLSRGLSRAYRRARYRTDGARAPASERPGDEPVPADRSRAGAFRFKVYRAGEPIALSQACRCSNTSACASTRSVPT
jgi:hypothetical protein